MRKFYVHFPFPCSLGSCHMTQLWYGWEIQPEKERGREGVCVYVREREGECVSERVCVCLVCAPMCVREREKESVSGRKRGISMRFMSLS